MQRVKKRIEDKHGAGRLLARQADSGDRGVMKTLVGYRWSASGASIELFYFAAQDPKNLFRTLSLHYKSPVADNAPTPQKNPNLPDSPPANPSTPPPPQPKQKR
jgi:hypothetical protein